MSLPTEFLTAPIAHRGFHDLEKGRPENSIAAVQAAIEAGYGIEIDLQLSSDDQAMVFHDYHLGRLTQENGAVRQRNAAELSTIKLAGGDENIPTLGDVLALVDGRIPILIELKDQDGAMGPNVGFLEQTIAADLAQYSGPVAVMSYNPYSVDAIKLLAPNVARGMVTSSFTGSNWEILPKSIREKLSGIPDYDRVGACFISHEAGDLADPRVTELRSQGAAILCWTIKSQAQEDRARILADNITFEGYTPQGNRTPR